jgi:hypothetical protein
LEDEKRPGCGHEDTRHCIIVWRNRVFPNSHKEESKLKNPPFAWVVKNVGFDYTFVLWASYQDKKEQEKRWKQDEE